MRINLMNNFQSFKVNFGELKLSETGNWDADYLNEFVHNKEVLKFVKYYHEAGIDIMADGHGKTGIGLYGKNKNNKDIFYYGIYGSKDNLKNFYALDAIKEIAKTTKEKFESIPRIEDANKFVEMFNTALKIYTEWKSDIAKENEETFADRYISSLKKQN